VLDTVPTREFVSVSTFMAMAAAFSRSRAMRAFVRSGDGTVTRADAECERCSADKDDEDDDCASGNVADEDEDDSFVLAATTEVDAAAAAFSAHAYGTNCTRIPLSLLGPRSDDCTCPAPALHSPMPAPDAIPCVLALDDEDASSATGYRTRMVSAIGLPGNCDADVSLSAEGPLARCGR
jgi:hypothetical protein